MEILYYTWEVICQTWPVMLLMGMIAIPILWIWLEENNEYEPLDDYYITSAKEQIEEYYKNKDKKDICDN
jgi:hypothetical protein